MPLRRPQFTGKGSMVAVAVCAVVTVVWILLQPVMLWVGFAPIPLKFVILDTLTGQPLERGSIRLVGRPPEYEVATGADGRAKIVIEVMTAGRSSWFENTRSVNYGAWELLVTRDGYASVREDFQEVTRKPRYHSDRTPPPIVIRLVPNHRGDNR
jgi:hypothetical protein